MLSRVADSLYWMSRYLERVENTARLIGVKHNYILDSVPEKQRPTQLQQLIDCLDLEETATLAGGMDALFGRLTFDMEETGSIVQCITYARENARNVRELISTEMWTQLNRLYLSIKNGEREVVWDSQPSTFYADVVQDIYLFQGITFGTMSHSQGWHFIQVGQYLERLVALAKLLEVQLPAQVISAEEPGRNRNFFRYAATLKSVSAYEMYCKVYMTDLRPGWMAEFLLFNREFPRSAAFCVDKVFESLEALAELTGKPKSQQVNRRAGRLLAALHYNNIDDALEVGLGNYLTQLKLDAYRLHESIYETYINYPVEMGQSQSQG